MRSNTMPRPAAQASGRTRARTTAASSRPCANAATRRAAWCTAGRWTCPPGSAPTRTCCSRRRPAARWRPPCWRRPCWPNRRLRACGCSRAVRSRRGPAKGWRRRKRRCGAWPRRWRWSIPNCWRCAATSTRRMRRWTRCWPSCRNPAPSRRWRGAADNGASPAWAGCAARRRRPPRRPTAWRRRNPVRWTPSSASRWRAACRPRAKWRSRSRPPASTSRTCSRCWAWCPGRWSRWAANARAAWWRWAPASPMSSQVMRCWRWRTAASARMRLPTRASCTCGRPAWGPKRARPSRSPSSPRSSASVTWRRCAPATACWCMRRPAAWAWRRCSWRNARARR